jgi:hypothetical protein
MGMQVLIKIRGLAFLTAYNGSYINSGCIGMIKPQRTQRTQRKRTER